MNITFKQVKDNPPTTQVKISNKCGLKKSLDNNTQFNLTKESSRNSFYLVDGTIGIVEGLIKEIKEF
jgi:hypothetical protein